VLIPLKLAQKLAHAESEVLVKLVDIETDFIDYVASLIHEPDLLRMLIKDRVATENLIYDAFDRIFRHNFDADARYYMKSFINGTFKYTNYFSEDIYRQAYESGILATLKPTLASSPILARNEAKAYTGLLRVVDRCNFTGGAYAVKKFQEYITPVGLGDMSINQSFVSLMDDFYVNGITGHKYPSGASITLAPYVRREMVTQTMNATREVGFERAEEWGTKFIMVSAHSGARPLCFPYQGRVFNTTHEAIDEFPSSYNTSYGEPAGLFGINCRHIFWPFFRGLNTEYPKEMRDPSASLDIKGGSPDINNSLVYEATQEQRKWERAVRRNKKYVQSLRSHGLDASKAERSLRNSQKQLRDYIATANSKGIFLARHHTREIVRPWRSNKTS
jgi:hypothetical protein